MGLAMKTVMRRLVLIVLLSCGGGGVSSNNTAQTAYLGLDESVDKAITLGFAGFNAASSANIPTETATGDISGTMTITGQVDQGQSANKQMRLNEALTSYADTDAGTAQGIVYATGDAGLASLQMSMMGIPTGTLSGSLNGTYVMTGALQGDVTLAITFTGNLQAAGDGGVEREPGHTHITGTATSSNGTYAVDLTR
jgi:hypothetical protein